MPISKIFVTRFFQLVEGRRFAEGERILERIRSKTNETEWNSGYLHALDGMLFTQRTGDSYSFLNNMNFKDEKVLKRFKKEFLKKSKNKIHADHDRGYFAAWADYMRTSIKTLKNEEPKK